MQVLGAAAIATAAMLVPTPPAQAAPVTFQTAVLANNPYLYYRFGETADPLTDKQVADQSSNNIPGLYRGTPTGGIAGVGSGSDTAVSFPGTALNYARTGLDNTTNDRAFGSLTGHSSYELVFKANTPGLTGYQSIFGVFNSSTTTPARTQNQALAVELNSNTTGNVSTTSSRFYVRDEDGVALGATIDNGNLLDGNYHDLLFTFDDTQPLAQSVVAYVDGISVPVAVTKQGSGTADQVASNFQDFTVDPTFASRNVRGTVGNWANITLDEAAWYGSILGPSDAAAHATAAGFVVPEPTSLALLGIGGLGLLRRRRRLA
jgi:hypothetical protein